MSRRVHCKTSVARSKRQHQAIELQLSPERKYRTGIKLVLSPSSFVMHVKAWRIPPADPAAPQSTSPCPTSHASRGGVTYGFASLHTSSADFWRRISPFDRDACASGQRWRGFGIGGCAGWANQRRFRLGFERTRRARQARTWAYGMDGCLVFVDCM